MALMDALDDVRVLEVGSTVVGPYATQALGALGADVVKVEPPGGDPFRDSPPLTEDGLSGYFAQCNNGKRGLRLDLKADDGLDVFYELAAEADVAVINFRPGTAERLGIGYDDLAAVREDLVYCTITGYGREGPWSDRPAFDPILQGVTGLMSVTGERGGSPVRVGVAIIDIVTAQWVVSAVTAALRARDRTGEGEHVDINMFDVGMSLLTKQAVQYQLMDQVPQPMGTEDHWTAPYGAYPTEDDELVLIGAAYQYLWERLCRAIDREDLLRDDRFETRGDRVEHREELNCILDAEFRERTRDEWVEELSGELPVGPILTVDESLASEQAAVNDVTTVVEHDDLGPVEVLNLPYRTRTDRHRFDAPPPALGEHSREILAELGVDDDRIDALDDAGVI